MLDQAFKNVCTIVGQCSVNMTAEFLFIMYSIPVNSCDTYTGQIVFSSCVVEHIISPFLSNGGHCSTYRLGVYHMILCDRMWF